MDHATVKVIDLWAAANLMRTDKMKYVEVSISEDGCIDFSAVKSMGDYGAVNYDPVEPIEGNPSIVM